jgi:hypothetical protein
MSDTNLTREQRAYRDYLLDPNRTRGTVTYSDDARPSSGPKGKVYFNASKKRWSARVNGKDCLFKTEAEARAALSATVVMQRGSKFMPPEPEPPERPDPEQDRADIERMTSGIGEDEEGDETCDGDEPDGVEGIYWEPGLSNEE